MNIDIGFWLSMAVLVGVLLWGADKLFRLRERGNQVIKETVEFSNSLLPVFILVLLIRSFVVEPFTIPSGSMIPTLEVNDFILVSKFSYGLRLPVTNTKILSIGEPKRGDVMVFRYPVDPRQNFIKRVIGLPGDVVEQRQGRLYVNGQVVEQRLISERQKGAIREKQFLENTGQQWHYVRQDLQPNVFGAWHQRSEDGVWEVPEGHYFMVGDNRDNSSDSRYWGPVPESHIVGKAMGIWMHWEPIFSLPRFHRNWAIDKVDDTLLTETQK